MRESPPGFIHPKNVEIKILIGANRRFRSSRERARSRSLARLHSEREGIHGMSAMLRATEISERFTGDDPLPVTRST